MINHANECAYGSFLNLSAILLDGCPQAVRHSVHVWTTSRFKKNRACGLRSGASHVARHVVAAHAGPDVIHCTGFPDRRLHRFASGYHHPRNSCGAVSSDFKPSTPVAAARPTSADVGAQRNDELCPLTNEQITRTLQHERGLALGRLDRNEPHARSRDRLADGRSICSIVLRARRKPSHSSQASAARYGRA
jgi:hypothetical protein